MNENKTNDSSLFIALIVLLGILYYAFSNFNYLIYELWRLLRVAQLSLIGWVPDWIPLISEAPSHLASLKEADSKTFGLNLVNAVDHIYYPIFGWIAVVVMIYLAKNVNRSSSDVLERLSMEGILRKYAKSFPHLNFYIDFNPAEMTDLTFDREDKVKQAYLPPLNPIEYATMLPPLHLEEEAKTDSSYMAAIYTAEDQIGFDEGLAEQSLIGQFKGKYFHSIDQLNQTERRVYEQFVVGLSFDKTTMQKVIHSIAKDICSASPKANFHGAKKTLYNQILSYRDSMISGKKPQRTDPKFITKLVEVNKIIDTPSFFETFKRITGENIMKSHAFTYTGLMSVLAEAKRGGTSGTADFKWVLFEDRVLFFCLATIGKQVSYVECAGVFSHWLMELQVGFPISTPEVTEAVGGLKISLLVDRKND